MSTFVSVVEVENITVDQPTCGRPCCRTEYKVRVLGKDIPVSKETFERINRKMNQNDRLDRYDILGCSRAGYVRRQEPVLLTLTLEE